MCCGSGLEEVQRSSQEGFRLLLEIRSYLWKPQKEKISTVSQNPGLDPVLYLGIRVQQNASIRIHNTDASMVKILVLQMGGTAWLMTQRPPGPQWKSSDVEEKLIRYLTGVCDRNFFHVLDHDLAWLLMDKNMSYCSLEIQNIDFLGSRESHKRASFFTTLIFEVKEVMLVPSTAPESVDRVLRCSSC